MNELRIKLVMAARFAAATCAVALMITALARANGPVPQNINDYNRRETEITTMEHGKNESLKQQATLRQINEDFKRLLELNVDLGGAYPATGSPDYKRLSEASAEIRKRASHLKDNLMLPPPGKEEKREKAKEEPGPDQLRNSVAALNGLIKSFTGNPIFKKDAGADPQQMSKARRDLEDIIEVSDRLKKAAEKLNKTSSKTS